MMLYSKFCVFIFEKYTMEPGVKIASFYGLFSYFWLCWVFVTAGRLSLGAGSRGRALVAVCRLLNEAASFVAEHKL